MFIDVLCENPRLGVQITVEAFFHLSIGYYRRIVDSRIRLFAFRRLLEEVHDFFELSFGTSW